MLQWKGQATSQFSGSTSLKAREGQVGFEFSLAIFIALTLGKTFVYNTLIKYYGLQKDPRDTSKDCPLPVVTATTGMASILLHHGVTSHKGFFIPRILDGKTESRLATHTEQAKKLKNAPFVIIDEVTMMHKDAFSYIDKTLRSIVDGEQKNLPFGGKIVLISGDWKQLLPVVRGAVRIESCLH